MPEQFLKEENLLIIKEIESSPAITQRDISKKLGISLGKTNYLLKQLIKKGLIKARNFSQSPYKLKKIHYMLTKDGFEEKLRLTRHFLAKKETEYYRLKQEWEQLNSHLGAGLPSSGGGHEFKAAEGEAQPPVES